MMCTGNVKEVYNWKSFQYQALQNKFSQNDSSQVAVAVIRVSYSGEVGGGV